MRRRGRHALAVLLLAVAAMLTVASPKKSGMPDDPFVSRRASAPPEDRRAPPRDVPRQTHRLPYPECPSPAGVVQRGQLTTILDRTPGVFLQGVDVAMIPTRDLPGGKPYWKRPKASAKSAFGGWYIRRFHPGDPCLGRTGLRVGDIIADVNGFTLQHPRDLVRLWKALRTAPRIIVRLYRNRRPLVFVVKIADAKAKGSSPRPNNR